MKKQQGFSLIEIIVTMAIMAIMTSMFFTVDAPRKKLEMQREAYLVAQNIRRMENMSASIQATPQCAWKEEFVTQLKSGLLPNQGYAVYFDLDSPRQYTLYANCLTPNEFVGNSNFDPSSDSGKVTLRTLRTYNLFSTQGDSCFDSVLDESWYSKKTNGCDIIKVAKEANNAGPKYGDETIEIARLVGKVKIEKIEALINGSYQPCNNLVIGFEPPDPATYIYCCKEKKPGSNRTCNTYLGPLDGPSIARITIKQDEENGEERVIEMNKAGLIWVKNK